MKPEVQLSLQLGCNQIKSYLLCVLQPSSKPCMCQNVQTKEQLPSDPGRIQSCSHPARISCQIIKSRLLLEFRCRFCTKTIASGCRFLSMSKGCYGLCSEHLHSRFQFVHLVLHPRLWKEKGARPDKRVWRAHADKKTEATRTHVTGTASITKL